MPVCTRAYRVRRTAVLALMGAVVTGLVWAAPAVAQDARATGVLRADWEASTALPIDRGWLGVRQALQRARTTASLLHITGHPDDEHAGMLTLESRGRGTRTALVSLNRGEGGANALGPELFDALGSIRTEELMLAGQWYGLDDLYFTSAVDYGYSKTLEEAYRSWDRERVLEDLVRIIRSNRPLVIVSRWHGSGRDGHGHHQAAGDLSLEAAAAAADPNRFPDQIAREGLAPWRALRVFRGGVREGEPTDVTIDAGAYAPDLGQRYQDVAAYGLSLQRSQTSGRVRSGARGLYAYELIDGVAMPTPGATSFFAGLDTSLSGIAILLGVTPPNSVTTLLAQIDQQYALSIRTDGAGIPTAQSLADALAALDRVLDDPWVRRPENGAVRGMLADSQRNARRALALVLGVDVAATARVVGAGSPTRVAAGDVFHVEIRVDVHADPAGIATVADVGLHVPNGWAVERVEGAGNRFQVTVGVAASPTTPYFSRSDIRESHYSVTDSVGIHRPWTLPPVIAVVELEANGTPFRVISGVRGVESALPMGEHRRLLGVAPSVVVDVESRLRVLRADRVDRPFDVTVGVRQGGLTGVRGRLEARVPEGWSVESREARTPFTLSGPGESTSRTFTLQAPADEAQAQVIRFTAVASVDEEAPTRWSQGETRISYPDLEPRYLPVPADLDVRVVDATVPDGLRVGYVMGVGDAIPEALTALDIDVDLLDADGVANRDLSGFDAVFIGTRAYAVRPELNTHNARFLDYAERGGHLVVLYQTPEYDASALAPMGAELPRTAEETSEEDAPVRLLAPQHSMLRMPNTIGAADFDSWVEQRGSKFFSRWGPEYTPLIETADSGQAPQQGVWLTVPVGDGAYTYCALALHRQTPYGVEGAFKILANLASYQRVRSP